MTELLLWKLFCMLALFIVWLKEHELNADKKLIDLQRALIADLEIEIQEWMARL